MEKISQTPRKSVSNQILFRIITVGDLNVGKTSLIKKYVGEDFKQEKSTIGIDISLKKIKLKDGSDCVLRLMDTAG